MKAIMIMYDSLNRHMLETYGCSWTKTPNFKRLAEKCVQFENSYVCSMPCMPARREIHTGRANFLHRSWGPLEPFDDSMPEILKNNGIYTHLASDHQHYWEDGGGTYHPRYSSWEFSRGQEGDPWKGIVGHVANEESIFKAREDNFKYAGDFFRNMVSHDQVNRMYLDSEEKTPQAVTFENGVSFIDTNHQADNWFLQIETFDPHEPFFAEKDYKDLYPHSFICDPDVNTDWPPYAVVQEDEQTVQHARYEYAALLSKCDTYLGKVLDKMDEYNLWQDTLLIVNTDHGFLLGEHCWWGKSNMPLYNEMARTPLYIYDPRYNCAGQKRNALVQTIDLAPTILEYFGIARPKDMQGQPLSPVIQDDTPIREYAVYGYNGAEINVTDGSHVYMHSVQNPDVQAYDYTLMPTHMRSRFSTEELQGLELAEPFTFTKGCRTLKIKIGNGYKKQESLLFDLAHDPGQLAPIEDAHIIEKTKMQISRFMQENDAPQELYERYNITR